MIHIEKAAPEHIDILIDFQKRLAFETEGIILSDETLRRGVDALFTDPSKGYYYIAHEDGVAVGCHSVTFEWSDWRNGMVLWLQSLYVIESHRKKGIFKLMYDNLIRMINLDDGLIGLRLYVDKSNTRAMNVYESMGMDGSHYTVYEWMK